MHVGALMFWLYQRAMVELPGLVRCQCRASTASIAFGCGDRENERISGSAAEEPINGFNGFNFDLGSLVQKCAQPFQLRYMSRMFGGCNPPNAASTGSRTRQPGASTGIVGCPTYASICIDVVMAVRHWPLHSPIPSEVLPCQVQILHWLHCTTASGYVSWFNNTHLRRVFVHLITCGVNLIA